MALHFAPIPLWIIARRGNLVLLPPFVPGSVKKYRGIGDSANVSCRRKPGVPAQTVAPGAQVVAYLQAVTMISTRIEGFANSACTQARTGAESLGSQGVQTAFIPSRSRMFFTQISACSRR